MRIGRIGLVGVATLVAACGDEKEPAKFRVGGTVTGLSGSLTLRLNGQQSLTRDADGPFSFETPLADKSDYAVTVATQPPEQECAVEGGTGKVAGTDVGSVQVRCGPRMYTLGGTVEGLGGTLELRLEGGEVLRVTTEGPFTFATKLPKGGTYAVSVATLPQGQRCSVSNGSGTVAGNVGDISVRCNYWYALDAFPAAKVVIGQSDFVSDAPNREAAPGANTLSGPFGNPVLVGGRLYVSDTGNHRVLGFNGVPAAKDAAAGFVLGQPDLMSTTAGAGRAGIGSPEGLSSDGTRLAVADPDNSRVLLYGTLPASTGAQPTLVIGQSGFDSTPSGTCDQKTLRGAEDVFIGHGKMLVADSAHHRILVWNTIPPTSGAPADLVLGQGSFTTCVENDADGNGVRDTNPSQSTLWGPTGVWTDGTRVAVADFTNNRVLLWNSFPTRNGQPADVVLGQTGFTSRAAATSATGMSAPYFIAATGLQLFVVDNQNNRVLGWNQFPTTNGAPADFVLGQVNLTTARQADPDTALPSARSLYRPSGLLLAWPHVVVPDANDNRLLVFESH